MGPKITYFRRFSATSQPNGNLTANIFGAKRGQSESGIGNLRVCYIVPKCYELRSTNDFKKIGVSPTLHKFCILFHCHALHTEVSKRNSTKLCQTVLVTYEQNAVNILGSSFSKMGPNCLLLDEFET